MYGVDKNYLLSEDYTYEMLQYYNGNHSDFIDFLYDADPKTDNYNWRHFQLVQKLGGWRWKGIFTYRKTFVDLIYNKSLKGIDFGGSQRPISEHLDIVDIEDVDLEEFADEIDSWIIDELKAIGCDTAKSVLEISVEDMVQRTDLEKETIEEVFRILKAEFE